MICMVFVINGIYVFTHTHKHTYVCTYTHANTHTHGGKMIESVNVHHELICDNNYADSLIEAL